MKLIFLGDIHFGKSEVTDEFLVKAFHVLFEYMNDNDIKTIIQLGDVFDSRKAITPKAGNKYVSFLNHIIDNDFTLYQLLGNHDCFYNNNSKINTPGMFFDLLNNNNIHLISKFEEITLENKKLTFIPWASDVKANKLIGDILFCHYSINGFEQQKGIKIIKGMKQEDFSGFDLVVSGHIHRRDMQKNILNIGSFIPLDFGEIDIDHGFYVYDTDSAFLSFVKVDINPFVKLIYDENNIPSFDDLSGKIVKIIARNVSNRSKFDEFKKKVLEYPVFDLIVNSIDIDVPTIKMDDISSDYSILDIIKMNIDQLNIRLNKDTLIELSEKVYNTVIGR